MGWHRKCGGQFTQHGPAVLPIVNEDTGAFRGSVG